MKLTVDASIVAKWFLTEPQSGDARQLLAPRLRLHAPDVLPVEYGNTIWKKVHRREIADTRPYLDGLTGLPEAVTLHDSRDLLNHALRIAVQMDHPVYDCLYLACAHATTSVLVTADQRFAKKAAGTGVDVWAIGLPGVADRIKRAATAPVIGGDKVEELIDAYEFFERVERRVVDDAGRRTDSPALLSSADIDLFLDSPAYKRLVGLVNDLADEERVDLLAIGWLGAGRFDAEWQRNLEHAYEMAGSVDNGYVASNGHHWRAGYERLKRMMQARGWPAFDTGS